MIFINKTNPPLRFNYWKNTYAAESNWSDFAGSEIYDLLRKALVNQQNNLCCYCEIALKEIDYVDAHIEHFFTRSGFPEKTFCFDNLLASCQCNDSCGHEKDKEKNRGISPILSPLNTNITDRFSYTGTGNIIEVVKSDVEAKNTIERLGLNCPRLVDIRLNIINDLDDEYTDFEDELVHHISRYNGFISVIKYVQELNE